MEVSHDQRHTQLPRSPLRAAAFALPWPASMCLGATSCLPCWGAAGGGVTATSIRSQLTLGHCILETTWGCRGRWWTLSFFPFRMQPQCTAQGTWVCSSAIPHPSSTSLLPAGESQLPGAGHSQAQPHWAVRSPGHPPTELSRLPPNSSSTSGNPNPTIHSHILEA